MGKQCHHQQGRRRKPAALPYPASRMLPQAARMEEWESS
jgi:hypothetical protein